MSDYIFMAKNKFVQLILVFVLFLFAITTTGVYAWLPVIAKNLDHHHQVSISAKTEHSSQWSLIHQQGDQLDTAKHKKNHNWTSYDEPPFHLSVKPIQADDHHGSIDPVFLLSFIFPLILLFLNFFERTIRTFDLRKRILYHHNSYICAKSLIVLHN